MGGKKITNPAIDKGQCRTRLNEIAKLSLGALGDDEAIAIIKERKELEALIVDYEKAEKEAAAAALLASQVADFRSSIEELNQSIAPDKSDEELLALIGRRKELEIKLRALETGGTVLVKQEEQVKQREEPKKPALVIDTPVDVSEEVPHDAVLAVVEEPPIVLSEPEPVAVTVEEKKVVSKRLVADNFGNEGIRINPLEVTGELKQYVDDIQTHLDSLGTYLQHLPVTAKANKAFMLKAAETDPAYAMHYADPGLKGDEDFCIQVAMMPNKRNSGNALAEMDAAVRTSTVVLAGVKQDYRNIRFALPNMEGYREMLDIAKRGALHRMQELKDSADVMLLVPKVLQKDQEFMRQVNEIVAHREQE